MPERDQRRERAVPERIAQAHRSLDARFAEVRAALSRAPGAAAAETFGHLREALEVHFDREDRLYYPVIWALRPERKSPLLAFIRVHERFRAILREIAAHLRAGSTEDAARSLDELAGAFSSHGPREEELLRLLDEEVSRAV